MPRFHTAEWEEYMRSRTDCLVVPVDAGHYLQALRVSSSLLLMHMPEICSTTPYSMTLQEEAAVQVNQAMEGWLRTAISAK